MSKILADSQFIGRASELKNIEEYFNSNDFSAKRIYNLFGESGIGKSFICRYLYDTTSLIGGYNKILVDFNSQAARSMINLIEAILPCYNDQTFIKTRDLLIKYYNSVDSSKPVFYDNLFDAFINEINQDASAIPILIIMDTVEVICNSMEWEKIRRFIYGTSNNICFLCSGINKVHFADDSSVERELFGFVSKEISEYFSEQVPSLKRELRKESSFLSEKIYQFTKDGHPILCGLLSDWLNEAPTQVSYILDNTREISEKLIITAWFEEAQKNDASRLSGEVLQVLAYFTKRMNPEILSQLLSLDISVSTSILEKIGRYSFVKYFEEDKSVILHDVVAELIRQHHPIIDIESHYSKIVLIYENLISDTLTDISPTALSYLKLELIYYHIMFADTELAIALYEQEFLSCLDTFDFSMCNILLSMVCEMKHCECEPRWGFISQVLEADLLLSTFHPQRAISIYENLKNHECYSIESYNAKADEIYARSIMNPCTVPKLNPIIAIDLFKECILSFTNEGDAQYRLTRAWLYLGMAYVRVGNSAEANYAFERAKEASSTNLQKISIYMELSKMFRLQQDVGDALLPLMKCDGLFKNAKVNKGKFFYYYGNVLRDLDEFDLAEAKYKDALNELVAGVDDFTLSELYFDYSWMEYLRSEHVNFDRVNELLEKGWELVQSKKFGVEYSEYYHMKYEIAKDQGDMENAFSYLDTAIEYAREYSNIYMLLDCLNHRVQQLFWENNFDKIPQIVEEMANIEKAGCKIRVFRGRAKLVQGDIYYLQGECDKAFSEWKEGFCIVALYGDSRTNVELFSDLFLSKQISIEASRKEKMKTIISQLGTPTKDQMKRWWNDMRVPEKFDYFIEELYN